MRATVAGFLRRHRQVQWALADQSMASGVNFLTGIALARGLGIAEFGRFSLAWLVVLFVQSLQDNGITTAMMSIGPKQDPQHQAAYYGGVFFQQAVLAGVSAALAWGCLHFAGRIIGDPSMAPLAVSVAVAILLCLSQDFLRRYFFATRRPAISFAGDAVRYIGQILTLVWVFLFLKKAPDVTVALWIIAGASGAGALLLLMFVPKVEWTPAALRRAALRNWRFSRWLLGAAMAQWTSGNLFVVTAGALLGVTAVGALKAAQSLIGVTHVLFQGMENVVPMRAAQSYHIEGEADLVQYLSKVARLGLAVTAVIAILFAVDPAFWFHLVFGEEFAQYSYVLRWYAVLYVLMFLALPLGAGLRAMEMTGPIFLAYVAGAVFSLATAYPLVKELGLSGVMVGLVSIQLLILAVMTMSFRQALVKRAA